MKSLRRTCAFCGHVGNSKNMKRLYPSVRISKIIMIASLSLIEQVKRVDMNTALKNISKNMTFICHSHVIQAAQYLCAEMVASGKRISYCDDPHEGKTIAYVSTADIPPHLVEAINAVSNSAETITARDVWTFINEALKRYYGTDMWPDCHEEEVGSAEEIECLARLKSKVEVETVSKEDVDMIKPEPHDDVASTMNNQGPCSSHSKSCNVAMEDLGKTEAADLQRYFLVKGERLLELFRFCPQCGGQLDKTHLKAVGSAAVVRFLCENCSVRKPSVKSWESKDGVASS